MVALFFEIVAYRGRTKEYTGTLYRSDGTTALVLASGSKVRFKAGRGDQATPLLDLVSGVATPNGSTVVLDTLGSGSTPARYTVRLAQDDLADIEPGTYDAEVVVIDHGSSGPADAAKVAASGTLHIIGRMGGGLS